MKKAIDSLRGFFTRAGSFENRHEVVLGLIGILFLAGLIYGPTAYQHFSTAKAAGGNTVELSGWAWSENVGWISFNCSDDSSCTQPYAVSEDTDTGVLSGYAWSSNIGWISFQSTDVSGCPYHDASSSCTPTEDTSTGDLTGWARACGSFDDKNTCTSGNAQNKAGGWQGWISLSCKNATGECGTSPYGVKQDTSTGAWTNFAWGGGPTKGNSIIGWIQFDLSSTPANVPLPPGCSNPSDCSVGPSSPESLTVQLLANGGTHVSLPNGGGPVVFTWSSSGARCDDIKNVSGSVTVPTSNASNNNDGITQNIAQTNEFTVTCYDSSGTPKTSNPVVIDVAASAPPEPPPSSCTPTLDATPSQVEQGGSSELDWDPGTCGMCDSLTGGSLDDTDLSDPSDSVPTGSLDHTTTYTLTCGSGVVQTTVRVQSFQHI